MREFPLTRRVRGRSARLTASSVLALTLTACQDTASPNASALRAPNASVSHDAQSSNAHIPDEYIVVFNDDVADTPGRANALAKAHGAALRLTYTNAIKGFSAHMSAQAAEAILNDPNVAYVEQDQSGTLAGSQTSAPWGLDRIDQASLSLDGVYNYPSSGAGVNVYILDSGIRHTHSQFGGRVVPAYSVINDGYGPDGCAAHGTHVAGVAGGSTWGAAKSATLYSVRVTDCAGSVTTSSLIAAVDWVTANHANPAIANMSLISAFSGALNTAVSNSIATGVTYVAAAGNANADACNYSPASVPGVIAVGAIGGLDARSIYSNYGSCVDLYAPGNDIYSATNTDDYSYALGDGTSEASAFAAGVAAMYLAANPGASPSQVQQAMISGATLGAVTGLSGDSNNRLLRVLGSGGSGSGGNAPPMASFTSSCQKVTCKFDGSSSRDDAGVVSYTWAFGDGTSQTASGSLASHSYSGKGTFSVTVKLTVTDAGGLTATAQKTLTIKNGGR